MKLSLKAKASLLTAAMLILAVAGTVGIGLIYMREGLSGLISKNDQRESKLASHLLDAMWGEIEAANRAKLAELERKISEKGGVKLKNGKLVLADGSQLSDKAIRDIVGPGHLVALYKVTAGSAVKITVSNLPDRLDEETFKAVVLSKAKRTKLERSGERGYLAVTYSPLLDDKGNPVAVVGVGVDLLSTPQFQKAKEEMLSLKPSENGYFYVVDSKTGITIIHPNPSLIGRRVQEIAPALAEMLEKRSGVKVYSHAGQKKITGYEEHPQLGWIVASSAPLSDYTYIQNRIALCSILAGVGIVAVAVAAIALFLSKHLAPLKRIAEATRRIAQGDPVSYTHLTLPTN